MAATPPTRSSTATQRRIEAFWNRITFLVGCGAIVAIVSSIVVVITQQVFRPPPVDEAYLEKELLASQSRTRFTGDMSDMKPKTALMENLPKDHTAISQSDPIAELSSPMGGPSTASIANALLQDVPKAVPVAAGIDDIESKREAIQLAVTTFFSAPTQEARLPMVRDQARVKPLMEEFYSRQPIAQSVCRGVGKLMRLDEPGFRFGYVQALFESTSPASLIIEEVAEGKYLVDWESMVRYGELSWADFRKLRPVEPKLLRVIASKSTQRPSSEPAAGTSTEWLELRHPAETGSLLGWFDRRDARFASLIAQLEQGGWKDVPVTLRLCYPQTPSGTGEGPAIIAGVEGKSWLMISQPSS
jgi:hypothetical protein